MMPIMNIAVALKSGHRLNIMPMNEGKQLDVSGLVFGPLLLSVEEARAIQQMLNTIYPEETSNAHDV